MASKSMTNLDIIPGINHASLELLEAAGFSSCESLAKAGVGELAQELERANRVLQISKITPTRADVEEWIATARDLTGYSVEDVVETSMPVNFEENKEVASMLATAPFAIPLPAKQLMERQLAVSDIPAAIFLNRYSGDLDVKIDTKLPQIQPSRTATSNNFVVMAEMPTQTRLVIDTTKMKSTDALPASGNRQAIEKNTADNDRVALIRGPRLETNLGRDPQSSFYIRGVLHSHPLSLAVGAVVTLLLAVVLPLAITSAGLLLASDLMPAHFSWVPKWLLAFPFAVPLVGIAYLIWGLNGKCRICGQKQFVPRMCLKNSKAHHVRGLGYIIPVCVHMLLFKWFRCIYCGTPVRLKK